MPPSSSPTRQPPTMYRSNSATEGEPSNATPRGLDEMMNAMMISGVDSVEIEEVAAAFQQTVNVTGNLDPDIVNGMAEDFMKRASIKVSQSQDEGNNGNGASSFDSKENAVHSQSFTTPPEPRPPRRGDTTPFDEDVTPTMNNTTPMSFAGKATPTPSESVRRGRDRTISRSGSTRSRSRTPMGSLLRQRSPTPERRVGGRSPARRARSQSPFRKFFSKSAKPDVSPAKTRGAPPSNNARSGLPPTPVRPVVEPTVAETPAAKSVDSYPSPPSTAGDTFCSPTPTQWTPQPGSSGRKVETGATPANNGVPQQYSVPPMAQPDFSGDDPLGKPSLARPEFSAGVRPNGPTTAQHVPAPATIPVNIHDSNPAQVNGAPGQVPIINLNLGKSGNKSRTPRSRTGRRGSDKRSHRAGGPEKSAFVQPTVQQPASQLPSSVPQPGISRTFSADSHGPTPIFIGSPPPIPDPPSQPSESMSPEDMETSPEAESAPVNNNAAPAVQFNIGAGGKKSSHGTGRSRRNHRKMGSPGSRSSVHRRQHRVFPRTSPSKGTNATSSSKICSNASEESAESSGGQTLRTESTCSSEVDYTGRRALVSSLRDEARDAYTNHDFRGAVLKFTTALKVHAGEPTAATQSDDLRAVLLANRAAALLMLNAYEAAGADCEAALTYVSDLNTAPITLASDSGPALRAKLYARMGKALLRLGKLQEAQQAFFNAINAANALLAAAHQLAPSEETEQTKRFLTQLITDAESGKIEVNRCLESVEELARYGNTPPSSSTPLSRRNSMQALLFVNRALEFAPGAIGFHEKKVALLASLKRWRELAGHCERLAALYTRFDGLFEDDLARWNPGVPRAESLKSTSFDVNDPIESSTKKLGGRAAAEAAVRLPHSLLPFYLRSLRLEERWAQASSAIQTLERFVGLTEGLSNHQSVRMKFSWLSREKDKLNRTSAGKDRGDSLFRNADYQLAAAQYTSILTIDAEGIPDGEIGEVSNAGGRLHAILHCNRAACLMALKKYHEAVTDCTSALRIHSHYMKAMLRRSRCYARLQRYEEAIVEYNRWLELVAKAKLLPNDPDLSTTPCLFDSPKEIKDDELRKVKQELEDVKRSKRTAENSARSEASFNSSRRQWYQDSFGGSDAGGAQQRREQWYSQKSSSSRRWDSFAGRSPKTGGPGRQSQQQQQQQQRSQSQRGFNGSSSYRQQRQVPLSPGSDTTVDHYSVLEVARNASDSQIKKAFRKMALKYHPDKNSAPEAADKFRRIKLAYEVLNDSTARHKYDSERFSRF